MILWPQNQKKNRYIYTYFSSERYQTSDVKCSFPLFPLQDKAHLLSGKYVADAKSAQGFPPLCLFVWAFNCFFSSCELCMCECVHVYSACVHLKVSPCFAFSQRLHSSYNLRSSCSKLSRKEDNLESYQGTIVLYMLWLVWLKVKLCIKINLDDNSWSVDYCD